MKKPGRDSSRLSIRFKNGHPQGIVFRLSSTVADCNVAW